MRWGIACVLLFACGSVNKSKPDAGKMDAPADAAPDAPPAVTLSMPMGPSGVDTNGGTGTVSVNVHTFLPSKTATVVFDGGGASLGTYAPKSVMVTTDGSGDATAMTTFTAGATAGTETTTMQAAVDGMESMPVMTTFPLVALQRIGYATPYANQGSFTPGYLLGIKLVVPTAGHLRGIGFYSPVVGPNIQIGIYNDNNGAPGTLIAQLAPRAIAMGANEIVIPPVAITAGNLWFMAVYDQTGHVGREGVGTNDDTIYYTTFTYGGTLPTTFPTPQTQGSDHFNYYVLVGA